MQNDFMLTSYNNIWFGYFDRFEQAGFTTACSCRLHGESDMVPGTLNLALHVGDNPQSSSQPAKICCGDRCKTGTVYYLCPGTWKPCAGDYGR